MKFQIQQRQWGIFILMLTMPRPISGLLTITQLYLHVLFTWNCLGICETPTHSMGGFRSCGKLQIEMFPFHTMVNFFTLRELIIEILYFGVSSSIHSVWSLVMTLCCLVLFSINIVTVNVLCHKDSWVKHAQFFLFFI